MGETSNSATGRANNGGGFEMNAHGNQSGSVVLGFTVDEDLKSLPEHEGKTAQVLRNARTSLGYSQQQIADAAGITKGLVCRHLSGGKPMTGVLLSRLAGTRPGLCEAIFREYRRLYPERFHVVRPLPERVCSVMAEVGDVSRAVHLALADGRVDDDEKARIRREIEEARAELDRLEQDLG